MLSNVLLVEPPKSRQYYTKYPPLGLLKISAYHKSLGDDTRLLSGDWNYEDLVNYVPDMFGDGFVPDTIYVTSLFTFYWKAVHETIDACISHFPNTEIKVGGIYASLCPDHLRNKYKNRVKVHVGVMQEVEKFLPDYSLVPEYDGDIVFASRGCVNKCKFCAVPILEPNFISKYTIKDQIFEEHTHITCWDNNILASPSYRHIFRELIGIGKLVDFNQGIDARLLDEEVAWYIGHMNMPVVRLAYDHMGQGPSVKKAIGLLKAVGVRPRDILTYVLYNFKDAPDDFWTRCKHLAEWGATAFPMRYEPLTPSVRKEFVGKKWSRDQLDMVRDTQRIFSVGGAFPPKQDVVKQFCGAKNFYDAFYVSPQQIKDKVKEFHMKIGKVDHEWEMLDLL